MKFDLEELMELKWKTEIWHKYDHIYRILDHPHHQIMWVRVFVLLSRSDKMIGTHAEDRLDRLHHQGCTLQAPVRKGAGSSPTPAMSCLICGLYRRWTQLTSHRSMFERCPKSGHPESNQGPSDRCTSLQSDALPTELCPVNFDHLASDKHKFYTPLIAEPFGRTSGKTAPWRAPKQGQSRTSRFEKLERHQNTGKIGVFSDRAEI